MTAPVYSIGGLYGKHLDVYEDQVVIKTDGLGALLIGNVFDGEKTIYYRDAVGIQFKKSGLLFSGYLQIETASPQMNLRRNNFTNENSFIFDISKVSNEKMEEVANYIKQRMDAIKNTPNTSNATPSPADELKKFKELLDTGVISQEEFDAKKKQILGL